MTGPTIGVEEMGRGAVDLQADAVADPHLAEADILRDDFWPVDQPGMDEGAVTEPLDQDGFGFERGGTGCCHLDMLRPEAEQQRCPVDETGAWHARLDLDSLARRTRATGPSPDTSDTGTSVIGGDPTTRATNTLAGRA
jgi:hypothetical protein